MSGTTQATDDRQQTREAAPALAIDQSKTAGGGNRDTFAKCLNDVSQEIALLPWDYDVIDEETGNTWDLDDYLNSNAAQLQTFKLLQCQQFAPVATSREGINRCVLDQVGYIREEYPGAAVQESALTFALAVCIPPYQP